MGGDYQPNYEEMFKKAISALAKIDEALGVGGDGVSTLTNTLNAINYLKAVERGDKKEAERIRELVWFDSDDQ